MNAALCPFARRDSARRRPPHRRQHAPLQPGPPLATCFFLTGRPMLRHVATCCPAFALSCNASRCLAMSRSALRRRAALHDVAMPTRGRQRCQAAPAAFARVIWCGAAMNLAHVMACAVADRCRCGYNRYKARIMFLRLRIMLCDASEIRPTADDAPRLGPYGCCRRLLRVLYAASAACALESFIMRRAACARF